MCSSDLQDNVQDNPAHPAVYISWDDVQVFIERLNEAAGAEIYRLPTEAEWEYACRPGTTTRWSFGDNESALGDYAWYRANAWDVGLTWAQPVGTKLPNPWGLHDMHSNVFEWVQDWYDAYNGNIVTDPTGPSSGSSRVLRGGVFNGFPRWLRSAKRNSDGPSWRSGIIGARLLRTQ